MYYAKFKGTNSCPRIFYKETMILPFAFSGKSFSFLLTDNTNLTSYMLQILSSLLRAKDKESLEKRAIKIISIDENDKDNFKKNIKNELNNMKICSNENKDALKYYETFHYKNKIAIVMELCDKNLKNVLDEKKNFHANKYLI